MNETVLLLSTLATFQGTKVINQAWEACKDNCPQSQLRPGLKTCAGFFEAGLELNQLRISANPASNNSAL